MYLPSYYSFILRLFDLPAQFSQGIIYKYTLSCFVCAHLSIHIDYTTDSVSPIDKKLCTYAYTYIVHNHVNMIDWLIVTLFVLMQSHTFSSNLLSLESINYASSKNCTYLFCWDKDWCYAYITNILCCRKEI